MLNRRQKVEQERGGAERRGGTHRGVVEIDHLRWRMPNAKRRDGEQEEQLCIIPSNFNGGGDIVQY